MKPVGLGNVMVFEQPYGFSDVDGSGSSSDAAAYLRAMAEVVRQRRTEAIALLSLSTGSSFLDAGCGLGEVVIDVARIVGPGGRSTGIDLSAELIANARTAATNAGVTATFEVGDVARLEFADESFDAVRCERVFQHLDDAHAGASVREFVRVAKRGGRIQLVDSVHSQHCVDCTDSAVLMELVGAHLGGAKDPFAGIRLARRLGDAGAVVVDWVPSVLQWPTFSTWRIALGVDEHLAALVGNGRVNADRAQAWMDELTERDLQGEFTAVSVGYLATGVKPR